MAPGGDLGRRRRRAAGARDAQRVAADLDDLRHGGPAHRRSSRSRSPSLVATLVGFSAFFGAVVHGRGDADAPRVRPSSAVLARLVEGARQLDGRSSGRTVGGYLLVSVFFAYDVLLYLIATRVVRLVDAVRSAAPSRRARDLRAVAVGDRQLVPGGLLGRSAVPRRADRGRGAHRRSLRPAPALPRHRASSSRRSSSAPATRRIRRSRRTRGRSS